MYLSIIIININATKSNRFLVLFKSEENSHSITVVDKTSEHVNNSNYKIFLLLKCQKVMMFSLQTFLSLKVNLVQPYLIVKKVLLLN